MYTNKIRKIVNLYNNKYCSYDFALLQLQGCINKAQAKQMLGGT